MECCVVLYFISENDEKETKRNPSVSHTAATSEGEAFHIKYPENRPKAGRGPLH